MTIIHAHQLSRNDLSRLGNDLAAQARFDHDEVRNAVNRSLSVHGVQLHQAEQVIPAAALRNTTRRRR